MSAPWKVPLADVRLSDEDIEPVVEVLRSGWLTSGPRTERFEADFARYVGSRHAIAVSSGTAALHLMCLAVGLGPGDEVVVPSLTFVATANAVRYAGARPVFADLAGEQEPWLAADACAAAITPRTKAILTMHYGGRAGQLDALADLARREGLVLLEDAAHAAGSRRAGRHLGTVGAAGAFSLFSNKNLAVGEGGLVVTDDDALACEIRRLRSHGLTSSTWQRHSTVAATYDVVGLGFNYRFDEARAALAARRLTALDRENALRAEVAARYADALADDPFVATLPPPGAGEVSSHHLFPVVLRDGAQREAFRRGLAEHGVETSVHYPPVHLLTAYKDHDAPLPNTVAYGRRTVTLPLFPHIEPEQVETVLSAVRATTTALAR